MNRWRRRRKQGWRGDPPLSDIFASVVAVMVVVLLLIGAVLTFYQAVASLF